MLTICFIGYLVNYIKVLRLRKSVPGKKFKIRVFNKYGTYQIELDAKLISIDGDIFSFDLLNEEDRSKVAYQPPYNHHIDNYNITFWEI